MDMLPFQQAETDYFHRACSFISKKVNVNSTEAEVTKLFHNFHGKALVKVPLKYEPKVPEPLGWGGRIAVALFILYVFSLLSFLNDIVSTVLGFIFATWWLATSGKQDQTVLNVADMRSRIKRHLQTNGLTLWHQATITVFTGSGYDPLHQSQGMHQSPIVQTFAISPRDAEEYVANWMRHLGDVEAQVTQYSSDGGIDVISPRYVAQVKHYGPSSSVGAKDVRELLGVAAVEGKVPLFFTSSRYTKDAQAFAERSSMPLFHYSVEQGTLTGLNAPAAYYRSNGL